MDWLQFDWNALLAWTVLGIIFVIGFLGTVIPILPGTVITFAGVLIHRLWMGEASTSWTFVWIAAGLAVFSIVIDLAASWWGAKRFGASTRGAIGALFGGIVGIFFGLPGLIIGPLVGAIAFELIDRRPTAEATRAGFGTLVGGLLGLAFKMMCTVAIIGGFFLFLP